MLGTYPLWGRHRYAEHLWAYPSSRGDLGRQQRLGSGTLIAHGAAVYAISEEPSPLFIAAITRQPGIVHALLESPHWIYISEDLADLMDIIKKGRSDHSAKSQKVIGLLEEAMAKPGEQAEAIYDLLKEEGAVGFFHTPPEATNN